MRWKRASHTDGPLISRNTAFPSMDAGGKERTMRGSRRKRKERDRTEEHQFSVGQASN